MISPKQLRISPSFIKERSFSWTKAERISKVMSRAGVCSRREAERWIDAKRVCVEGKILESPACVVTPNQNILIDGKPLPYPDLPRLWLYHKPRGLVTTHHDPQGRPTVFETLPKTLPRVISVGRLDQNSEGLLLLTNDGELSRFLEHPTSEHIRLYKVRIYGCINPKELKNLEKGLVISNIRYRPIQARFIRQQRDNCWIELKLTEGKNREIRNILSYLGWPVNRLIRLSYGPYALGALAPGEVKEVSLSERSLSSSSR